MDWNENLGDTSIDDIFNFNPNTKGDNKKKRSSILKQTKKANIDIYENEETVTDYRRNRQSMKRVSFAETFQVKELHTGNIYDIPGFNESSQRSHASIQLSYATESETNNFGGNFPSRSFLSEASIATFKEPSGNSLNIEQPDKQDDMDLCKNDRNCLISEPSYSILEKSSVKSIFQETPSLTSKTVRALLEDKEIMDAGDNSGIYPEPYGKSEEYLKEKSNVFDEFDFLGESLLKSGSQEYKENSSKLPFSIDSENVGLGRVSHKSVACRQTVERDILNKENIFQTSPNFRNLKFIDSPPSWKSGKENILKHQYKALAGNDLEDNPVAGVTFENNNKATTHAGNVLAQDQRKDVIVPSEADKENVYFGMAQKATHEPPTMKFVSHAPFPSSGGDKSFVTNKTRYSVSAMDLTLLPEAFNDEVNVSQCPDEPSLEDQLPPLNSYAGNVVRKGEPGRNKKTLNKMRLSTCDMDMTCAFDCPMNDSSLSFSPPSEDNLGTIGELGFVGTIGNEKLNGFKVTEKAADESPKNSQQSNPNFSFEEIEQDPPSNSISDRPNSTSDPPSNLTSFVCTLPNVIDEQANNPMLKNDWEEALMNRSIENQNHCFNALITSSRIAEYDTLKKMGPKLNLGLAEDVAPGRKFLKFSAESVSAPDRLQTQSPGKTLESSFMLKNKENLHSNRKRTHSSNKLPRVPLGFRMEESEVSSRSQTSHKSLSEMAYSSKAGSISSEESTLSNERVHVENNCGPEIPANRQTTHVFRSEILELTCHNLSLKGKEEQIATPIMKQVHILTETKISSPDVVFSSRKYEKTRYSTNNMDLTCLPESEDSSDVSIEAGTAVPSFVSDDLEFTCNFKSQSQYDKKKSMSNSAFRSVERFSSCDGQTGKSSQWPLSFESSNNTTAPKNDKNTQYFPSQPMELTCKTTDFQDDRLFVAVEDNHSDIKESSQLLLHSECLGNKTLTKFENKTEYFVSHPMELTCKTTNFQDESLFVETPKSDNFADKEYQVPPFFHLKELSVSNSKDKKSSNCNVDHSVRARKNMFKVTTDSLSSSKPNSSSSRPETLRNSILDEESLSSRLPPNSLDKEDCQNAGIVNSVMEKNPCLRVSTTNQSMQKLSREIVLKESCAEVKDKNHTDLRIIKNPPPSRTPGVVYKIRKIKQAFKEKGNLVLYPELSEALRTKQKFSFKHPYSEMKLTSPEIKDGRQNRSFNPSSQENSFTCLSREGSRLPSIGQLSSHFQEASEDDELSVTQLGADVKSVCHEIENINATEKHQTLNVSQVHCSVDSPEKYPGLNVSNANCSMACPEKLRGLDFSKVYPSVSSPEKYLDPNVSKFNCSVASPEMYLSVNASKINRSVSYIQAPSIMYDDDSLQLLQHSALENSFLEAASKNYTICLDRSDFVLKEKCMVPTDKHLQLMPPSSSIQTANESNLTCSTSMSQDDLVLQAASKSPEKSKINYKAASVVNEKALGKNRSFFSPQISKTILTKETQFDDLSVRQEMTDLAAKAGPCHSQRETSMDISSFAARIRENDCSFPIASLVGHDVMSPTREDGDTINAFNDQEDTDSVIVEEIDHVANNPSESSNVNEDLNIVSEAKTTLIASNAVELLNIQEDVGKFTAVEKTSITNKAIDSLNIQYGPNIVVEEMDTNSQAEEKQNNCVTRSDISITISNKLQKLEATNSPNDPDVKFEHSFRDLATERSNEEFKTVNEKVLMNQAAKPEDCGKNYDENSSDYSRPVVQNDLNSFEDKLEKASRRDAEGSIPLQRMPQSIRNYSYLLFIEGIRWKLQTLCVDAATFEVTWAVFVYKCVLKLDVKRINASESSISFTPVGENVGRIPAENVFGDIQERGYTFFQYLVADTILPFPVLSEKLIDKLTEYSKIANDVETLMRDLLKLSFAGECINPYELDPLTVTIRAINANYKCIYDMTFCVDLRKYPREKIVPEVKHVLSKDLTKEVKIAAGNVAPGINYLFRMMDAARELKP